MTAFETLRLLGAGWLAGFAMTFVWLWRENARHVDDLDRHLSAIDADIDAARDRHPSAR